MAGGGAEREHLEETARRCGVADYVIFAGERHDVAAVLSAADLVVASSRQETFGLSVLEALANGIRVLYTTCPALAGIDVTLARHVPMEDMGKAIAEEIAAGPSVRAPEPAVAREFGIAAVTARIDDLYERLAARLSWRTLAGRPRRRARQEASARARVAAQPTAPAAAPLAARQAALQAGLVPPAQARPPRTRPAPRPATDRGQRGRAQRDRDRDRRCPTFVPGQPVPGEPVPAQSAQPAGEQP